MSAQEGFTDSTDWLDTPLSALAPLDAALRCQVCKDFFTTPMITSCSHTFCSLCIRRYLSQEGRCPACRESDQEIKLRRNWSIEEAVAQFKDKRDELLKVARTTDEKVEANPRPKKRRKVEHRGPLPERRSTRSHSRRIASQETQNGYTVISSQEEVQDSDEEGSVYEDGPTPKKQTDPHDGLVACPCCGKRMKETFINAHLDRCMAGEASPSPPRSHTPQIQPNSIAYNQTKPSTTPQERLPTINYSLLNEAALRRKLKELGIPNHGSKELMRKRHTEWINLWNANCDSLRPVSKQQLLKDLDRWEKTLGRQVDRAPNGVMVKDFDRDNWQKSNKSDFDDLIRKAREKRAAAAAAAATATDASAASTNEAKVNGGEEGDGPAADNNNERKDKVESLKAIFAGTSSTGDTGQDTITNGDQGNQSGSGTPMDISSTQIPMNDTGNMTPTMSGGLLNEES